MFKQLLITILLINCSCVYPINVSLKNDIKSIEILHFSFANKTFTKISEKSSNLIFQTTVLQTDSCNKSIEYIRKTITNFV